jgi:hypothetical protein
VICQRLYYDHNKGILLNEMSLTFFKNYDVLNQQLVSSDWNYNFIVSVNVLEKTKSTLYYSWLVAKATQRITLVDQRKQKTMDVTFLMKFKKKKQFYTIFIKYHMVKIKLQSFIYYW